MRISRKDKLCNTGLFHKMWQGHNFEKVLEKNVDKQAYINALETTMDEEIESCVEWYSYCLMNTHPHETGNVAHNPKNDIEKSIEIFGNWMRNAHSRFGAGYNKRHGRKGSVACERPRTEEIEDEPGVLQCMFYGDANPVRAGLVSHPSRWQYSSYRFYAYGKRIPGRSALTPPPAYLALGKNPLQRRRNYRKLCDAYLRREGILRVIPERHEIPASYEEEQAKALAEMVVNEKANRAAIQEDS